MVVGAGLNNGAGAAPAQPRCPQHPPITCTPIVFGIQDARLGFLFLLVTTHIYNAIKLLK